ncbi:hypothetical protein GEMRC1_005899 [Eukaryota sp. GEM-RC1]
MNRLLIGLLLVCLSLASVTVLNQENFDETIKSHDYVLVKWFAPWCGHCKTLQPEYEEAAKTIANSLEDPSKMILAEVDCDENEELCQTAGIQGFPTIHLFRNGQFWTEYQGERNAENIVGYSLKMTMPLLHDITSDEQMNKFKEANKVFAFVHVNKDTEEYEALNNLAANYVDRLNFGRFATEGEAKFVLHKTETDEELVFEGDIKNEEELTAFIEANRKPVVVELSRETFADVFHPEAGPIGILFVDPKKDTEIIEKYTKIGEQLKAVHPTTQLTTIDAIVYGQFMERLGHTEVPSFTVVMINDNAHFNMPKLDVEAIPSFVQEVIEGKTEKYVRSEDAPSEEEQGVCRVAVRNTFEQEVLHPTHEGFDVLVMYWAPFCGHCTSFKPIVEELANHLKMANSKVKVVLFNADANDVPETANVDISGYPTVVLYTANEVDVEPAQFEGDRTVTGLLNFLKENVKTELPEIHIEEVQQEEDEQQEEEEEEMDNEEL